MIIPMSIADLTPTLTPPGIMLARGVCRAMAMRGWATLTEVTLANGRRADIMMLDGAGNIAIIEVKSSVADFMADRKWREYREFCDTLSFAVPEEFPLELIPEECGLIIADRFDAEIVRVAPRQSLNAARRKALTLRFAQLAALRLARLGDPNGYL